MLIPYSIVYLYDILIQNHEIYEREMLDSEFEVSYALLIQEMKKDHNVKRSFIKFRDFVRVQSERDMGTQYEEHFIHAIEVKTEFLSHLDEEEQYYFKDKEKLLVSEGILYDLHLS